MQSVDVPTGDRNPNGHSGDEVIAALQGITGTRRFTFRYELVDLDGITVEAALGAGEALPVVLAAEVSQNWLADIKRTARFTMRETGLIDYLSDRIRPHVRVWLPPYGTDDFVEFPQGLFLLTSPKRTHQRSGAIVREVDAYDQLQVFSDDAVDTRYAVAAGANIIAAVVTLLDGVVSIVEPSAAVMATTWEWEPGTSKLKIINELLTLANYNSLSFDEMGAAIVNAYRSPADRTEEYTYATDQVGVMLPEVDQELDVFSVHNKWVLVVSEPDMAPLVSTYTNTDPASPTSTVRRGRTITDYRLEEEAIDQASLDAKAARLAFEASQIFEALDFHTGIMPIHSGNDVYRVRWDALAVNASYAEHSWSMPLRAGAVMAHRARRVVSV